MILCPASILTAHAKQKLVRAYTARTSRFNSYTASNQAFARAVTRVDLPVFLLDIMK